MDSTEVEIGQKVHYIPFEGCHESLYENGIVKSIPEHTKLEVFVVFKCGGDWGNYQNYTGALTRLESLKKGWIAKRREEIIS